MPRAQEGTVRAKPSLPVLTVGHSTHTIETFVALLKAHGVRRIIDVRTIPRSRHNPQFNQATLPGVLRVGGIDYLHMAGLGGLRRPRADSRNTGWRNASFRGYADYMQTSEFEKHLKTLMKRAARRQVAIMCAEAVPWRCHRSLIADALVVCGVPVEHIMSARRREPHTLTPWARVEGTGLTYPAIGTAREETCKGPWSSR